MDVEIDKDGFVFIKGGTFLMGSPAGEGFDAERPQHSVTVSSFYMGKYPVTQREYTAVMGNNPSGFKGDTLPVEQVSWYVAVEYCNKRSLQEGLIPAYTQNREAVTWNRKSNGYRLPTEAEWEYAAFGGNASQGYFYAGSNDLDTVAWYSENSGGKTHAVGKKMPNELGLYDMLGNVWEWCWDWYGAYSSGAQTDPAGVSSGSFRVNRGGSWLDSALLARSAYRFRFSPAYRIGDVGFRLVRSAGEGVAGSA